MEKRCDRCLKYKHLKHYNKYKGYLKPICKECENKKPQNLDSEIKTQIKKEAIKQLQKQSTEPLSEFQVFEKIKIMVGDKVEFCTECLTWKEKKSFIHQNKGLLISKVICKDCEEKRKILTEIAEKPIVKIKELNMETKECRTCGKEKKVADFYSRLNNGRIYYSLDCKGCAIEAAKINIKRKKQVLVIRTPKDTEGKSKILKVVPVKKRKENPYSDIEKFCNKCEKWKPFSEFWVDKGAPSGHYSSCKACNNRAGKRKKIVQKVKIIEYKLPYQPSIEDYLL
jgi:hypothetical protein